jgi:hypothetical protein
MDVFMGEGEVWISHGLYFVIIIRYKIFLIYFHAPPPTMHNSENASGKT